MEVKVKQIVHSLVYEKGYACSVDLLTQLGYLSSTDLEAWRFGRVSYLESVCHVNLSKLTLISKTMRQVAVELHLERSVTVYHKFGKGAKMRLRFSKSGQHNIEEAYSTHYLDKKRIGEVKINKAPKEG